MSVFARSSCLSDLKSIFTLQIRQGFPRDQALGNDECPLALLKALDLWNNKIKVGSNGGRIAISSIRAPRIAVAREKWRGVARKNWDRASPSAHLLRHPGKQGHNIAPC